MYCPKRVFFAKVKAVGLSSGHAYRWKLGVSKCKKKLECRRHDQFFYLPVKGHAYGILKAWIKFTPPISIGGYR